MAPLMRFAPSPTGLLHVGNVRTALVNWLYTKQQHGQFMLRMDDTDVVRSKPEYALAIEQDLRWLGLEWDVFARQSDRLDRYEAVKQQLVKEGRLYPCFEAPDELETKRKMQLSRGLPPIYDRASRALSDAEIQRYLSEGRKPHYRFLLTDTPIDWPDQIRGATHFEGKHLSDPIVIREDGTMTYILSSVIDDIDFKITHIVRGEDHVSNTAIQVQIFEALRATPPVFAHLALIKSKDAEISKRLGGFDIRQLREDGIEAMSIVSMLAKLGTSEAPEICYTLPELVSRFDISQFGRAPANYDPEELLRLNHKYLTQCPFSTVQPALAALGLTEIDESFWLAVRANLTKLPEIQHWWNVCRAPLAPVIDDADFLHAASTLLPEGDWDESTWTTWVNAVKNATGRAGKQLFMPIRRALTGNDHGPELKVMLPLIGRARTLARLQGKTA